MGMGQVADYGAVDQGHQWYGNIRKYHRRGQRPDLDMGRAVAPVGQQTGHGGSWQAGIVAAVLVNRAKAVSHPLAVSPLLRG
ncbi:hypothetical protein D3C72_2357880 [compost metagenome]